MRGRGRRRGWECEEGKEKVSRERREGRVGGGGGGAKREEGEGSTRKESVREERGMRKGKEGTNDRRGS